MVTLPRIAHGRQTAGWTRWKRGAPVAIAAVALCIAGCGAASDPGVAQISPTPGTTRPEGPPTPNATTFSACMRAHGEPKFPDPNSHGQLLLDPASGIDPNSPQFQAAASACQSLRPNGGNVNPSQGAAEAVKYGTCMRSHGVPNFPDPTVLSGGFSEQIPSGVDINSPQFQAALRACQSLSPLPGGGVG